MYLSPKGEKEGHHKLLRGQACPDHSVRHWAMWLWDNKTYALKVKHVLTYFYLIRSWELNSLSDWTRSLVMGMGRPCQIRWKQNPHVLRQESVQEMEQDHPLAQPKKLSCNIQGHSPCQGSPPPHNESVGIANPRISPLLLLLLTVESCVYFPMTSQEVHGNISRYKIYSFSYL